ncbi:hypothetical protein JCM10207_008353 [Rhodosporidiobolus poonsookiae]
MVAVPDTPTSGSPSPSTHDRDPLDASLSDAGSEAEVVADEDEISEGPAACWEVAYVYAFLDRFTDLIDYEDESFPNVMAFEQALLDCSPPSETPPRTLDTPLSALPAPRPGWKRRAREAANPGAEDANQKRKQPSRAARAPSVDSLSSLSDVDADAFEQLAGSAPVLRASVEPLDPIPPPRPAIPASGDENAGVPPASELVRRVMDELIALLSQQKELTDYHGKKTWFHFLINFASLRLNQGAMYTTGFRWQRNWLRTTGLKPGQEKERNFWLLRWEDKVHLMREMIDYALMMTPTIKDAIKTNYDLGNQRIAKRDPDSNPLVILPLGRTSALMTVYHLDDSPRLYASGSPYKSSSPWVALCSSLAGYKAFVRSLAEPDKADRKKVQLKGPFARAAGWGTGGGATGKKGKGKESDKDEFEEERVLRARLEAALPDIEKYEEAQEVLRQKAERAAERAAERDARVARNLARLAGGTTTRSTRLRTRGADAPARPNYDEDDFARAADDERASVPYTATGGRGGKRRRTEEGGAYADSDDAASTASGATGRRAPRGSKVMPPAIPGERRSNRLQLKDDDDVEGEGEGELEPEQEQDGEQEASTAAPSALASPQAKESSASSVAGGEGEGKPVEPVNGAVNGAAKAEAEEAAPAPAAAMEVDEAPKPAAENGAVEHNGATEA